MSRLCLHGIPAVARRHTRGRRPRAFTMAEVLFAIIILGIGLILLAAAFPVGIAQTQKTQDATTARLIADHALSQLTKVVSTYYRPDPATFVGPAVPLRYALGNYRAQPMTMGLLDGAAVTDLPTGVPKPDLRLKLIYPHWPVTVDSAAATNIPAHPSNAINPTLTDGRPQDPDPTLLTTLDLGLAADYDVLPAPATFLNIWGWRFDAPAGPVITPTAWHENVQWAFPADRRYYWYAFYRQMYEAPDMYHPTLGYQNPLTAGAWDPNRLAAVRNDHITRRTYRVWIVAAKLPTGRILPPEDFASRPAPNNTPADYATQWYPVAGSATVVSLPADQWYGPAPVRVPFEDGLPANLSYNYAAATGPWLSDTAAAGGYLYTGLASGRIRRGDNFFDAWGNIYEVVDLATNSIKLDRQLPPSVPAAATGAQLNPVLPFWFNPNALAVFPTFVTKQADLP